MNAKTPRKRTTQGQFVAPFSLRLCEKRLQTKAQRRRLRWFAPQATQVDIDQINRDSADFRVTRGSAVVRGRFDHLADQSTLVNFEARLNWFWQLLVFFRPGYLLLFTLPVPVLIFLAAVVAPAAEAFNNSYQATATAKPLPPPEIVSPDARLAQQLFWWALIVGMFFYIYWFRAWQGRRDLAREVVRTLTDQITDVPDLSGLAGEISVSDDGELVAAPPLIPSVKGVHHLQDDDELLQPKHKADNRD